MDVSALDAELGRLVLIAAALAVNLHALLLLSRHRNYWTGFVLVCAAVAALAPLLGAIDAFVISRGAAGRGGIVTAVAYEDVFGFVVSGGIISGLVAALVGLPCLLGRCWWQRRRDGRSARNARPLAPGYRLALGEGLVIIAVNVLFLGCRAVGSLFPGWSFVELARVTFCLAPDGKTVVYSQTDGRLYRLYLPTGRVRPLTARPVGHTAAKQLVDPAFSPDGKRIACGGATGLTLLTAEGAAVRSLALDERYAAFDPSFSPDGRQIAFVRARNNPNSPTGVWWVDYDLWMVDVDGTDLRRLTAARYLPARRPRCLPDGHTIVFAAERQPLEAPDGEGSVLYALDVAQPAALPTPLARFDRRDGGNGVFAPTASDPAVSRDGKRVAFISDVAAPYHYDVCVADLAHLVSRRGTHVRVRSLGVTDDGNVQCQSHAWTPDGKSLFYLAADKLWRVDADGGNRQAVAAL